MKYCKDMYIYSIDELEQIFGSFGANLYNLIRGVDKRDVNINRARKSVSVEDTFIEDIKSVESCIPKIGFLFKKLIQRCKNNEISQNLVKEMFIKVKFNDFKVITRQCKCSSLNLRSYIRLFNNNINNPIKPIRLLGLGFTLKDDSPDAFQYDIFDR
jgi:DNA polymerase-4